MSDDDGALTSDERHDVLRSLAAQPLRNVVCLDPSFAFCAMPEAIVAMGFETPEVDRSVGDVLEAMPAADRGALIGALEEARRTGVGTAQVRLTDSAESTSEDETLTGLCIVDLSEDLGVYVVVTGELDPEGFEKFERPEPSLRPRRLVHHRDETARFVRIDPLTESLLGWSEDDLLGTSALDLIHPDDRDRGIQSWMEMLAGRSEGRYRIRFKTLDDGWRWLEITNNNRLDDPTAGYVETEMVDVDDEMSALARVRAGERQFKTLTESLPVGVVQMDNDANIVFANEWIRRLVGLRGEDDSDRGDLDSVHPDDREKLRAAFRAAIENDHQGDFDIRLRNFQTRVEHLCRVRVRPLRADSEIYGAIASIEDVTESASLQSQLRLQASTDHLTGLRNRVALIDEVQQLLDAATGRDDGLSLAVLFIDLDDFKLINDGLGHDAGDELLVEVGSRLTSALRADDIIARVGGDEFVIVCPWTRDLEDAGRLAERILAGIHDPFIAGETVASIGCSIGIAMHNGSPTTSEVMIGNADLAMYEAKRAGGGRWEPYGDALRKTMTRQFEVQRTINGALRNGEFSLFLQPIFDMSSGGAVAAECLIRWHHPTRGLIAPGQFIPVAERSGLIVTLGRWILDEACRLAARVESEGVDDFRIAVNISGRQLRHEGFAQEFFETVERHRLKPSDLILEVTETIFVETDFAVLAVLDEITRAGVTLALDDFGTGFSSLNHLRVMPVTMLKIDSSYTADIGIDAGTTAIMESIGELSRRLGLELVVEGIETDGQRRRIEAMGVPLGQGFGLSVPLDEAAFFAALPSLLSGSTADI